MTPWEMVAVASAGVAAGTVNAVVGSGTLITFPVLLAVGLPRVTATVSNALGLVPGAVSGATGFRAELRGQRRRLLLLSTGAVLGALTGASLLLALPASACELIVPVLVGLAVLLVAFQPLVVRAVPRRGARDTGPLLWTGLTWRASTAATSRRRRASSPWR